MKYCCGHGLVEEECHTCISDNKRGSKPSQWIPKKLENIESINGMSHEEFEKLLKELDSNSMTTLIEKNARYSINGDSLHNFRSGAEIIGGTPAQACWGYMSKHLTALRDKVIKNDFSDREDLLEKCQDTINYIRFLWCIGNDEINKSNEKESK